MWLMWHCSTFWPAKSNWYSRPFRTVCTYTLCREKLLINNRIFIHYLLCWMFELWSFPPFWCHVQRVYIMGIRFKFFFHFFFSPIHISIIMFLSWFQAMYLPWVLAIFNMVLSGGYVYIMIYSRIGWKNV